jgi:hypothetical protein
LQRGANSSQDKLYLIAERIPDGQNGNPGLLGFQSGDVSKDLAKKSGGTYGKAANTAHLIADWEISQKSRREEDRA